MSEQDDNFLSRWSRRKVQVKQGVGVPAGPDRTIAQQPMDVTPAPDAGPLARDGTAAPVQSTLSSTTSAVEVSPPPPSPTMDDVALLNTQSDFSRFVAPDVDASVKTAAMKKLFADPHFNVMDGLDTYIDDYNKFEPLSAATLRQMVGARMLGLLDDELEEQPLPDTLGPSAAADTSPTDPTPPDEDAAVQLQPDDAAGQPGAGERAAGLGDREDPVHDAVPPRGA